MHDDHNDDDERDVRDRFSDMLLMVAGVGSLVVIIITTIIEGDWPWA